jgi:hypothetical protein
MRWGLATLMSAIGSQLLVNQFQAHDPLVRRFFLFQTKCKKSLYFSQRNSWIRKRLLPLKRSKAVPPSEPAKFKAVISLVFCYLGWDSNLALYKIRFVI